MHRSWYSSSISCHPGRCAQRESRDPRTTGLYGSRLAPARAGLAGMTGELQTPRDQQLHDLVGAGIDALYPRVAVHARNRVFVHIAIAAEQLQAAVDDLVLQVGEPVLRHRGGHGVELALDMPLDAMVVEDPPDGRLALAFGELELRVLEFDDRLAERLALLDVVDGQPQRTLDHADRRRADD